MTQNWKVVMHSKLLLHFCVCDKEEDALWLLNTFDDIDILYDEGSIVRSICVKNRPHLLKAALDYFENKQFLDKGAQYQDSHHKLLEILEEASDWTDSSSEMHSLISEYLGSDIARLCDVSEAQDLVPSEQHAPKHRGTLTLDLLSAHDRAYCTADSKDTSAVEHYVNVTGEESCISVQTHHDVN